jgi:predicted transcriptional regulator
MPELMSSVPFGSDSALSAREIWRALDCWAEVSVQHNLNRLAEAGTIKRRQQPTVGIAFRWIYWREAA